MKVLTSNIIKRVFKLLALGIAGLLLISLLLSALVLIPAVQTRLCKKAAKIISEKTGIEIKVGGVFIAFPKTVRLENFYAADAQNDTLLYFQEVDIDAALLPLMRKKVNINSLGVYGLRCKVYRNESDTAYNYSPILSAFAGESKKQKTDPEKSKWELGFEEVEIQDLKFDLSDRRDSLFYRLELGSLNIDANDIDLASSKLNIEGIELSDTKLIMSIPEQNNSPKNPSSEASIPFDLLLESLKVSNVDYELSIGLNKLALQVSVSNLDVEPELIDLPNSRIVLGEVETDGISSILKMSSSDKRKQQDPSTSIKSSNHTFGKFDWDFLIRQADISNTSFKMDMNNRSHKLAKMDYEHMHFMEFNVTADSIFFNKNETGADVKMLSIRESTGPKVKHLSGKFLLNNSQIRAHSIDFKSNESQISGNLELSYSGLRSVGNKLKSLGISSDLAGNIVLKDLEPFLDQSEKYPWLKKIDQIQIKEFESEGTVGDFQLNHLDATIAKHTRLKLSGNVKGLPGKNLNISYALDTLTASHESLSLLGDVEMPSNFNLPQYVGLKSKGQTNLIDGNITAELKTDVGQSSLTFDLSSDHFETKIDLISADLGSFLADSTLGKTSLSCRASGEMKNFIPQQMAANAQIHFIEWNKNSIDNSAIDFLLEDDVYHTNVHINDSGIIMDLKSKYFRSDSTHHFTSDILIDEVELKALHLFDEYFKVSGSSALNFSYRNEKEFQSEIFVKDLRLENTGNNYTIDEIIFKSEVDSDESDFHFTSDVFDAALTGNTRLNELDSAFLDHIDLYLTLPDSIISSKDFKFDFNLNLKKPELFTDFLIPELHEFQLEKCQLHYDDGADILTAEVFIPMVNYKNIKMEDLSFTFDTKTDSAVASLGLSQLLLNTIAFSNLGVTTVLEKEIAHMSIFSKDSLDKLIYQLDYTIDHLDSTYKIFIDHNNLVFNYKQWDIPEDNMLVISNKQLLAKSTIISNNQQQVSLRSDNEKLEVEFNEFALTNLTGIIKNDTTIEQIDGMINGSIDFKNVFSSPEIHSKISINDLSTDGIVVGDLSTALNYRTNDPLTFDASLQSDVNKIIIEGTLDTREASPSINTNLDIRITEAKDFEPFVESYLNDLHGSLSGTFNINGELTNPKINGEMRFDDLGTTVSYTNTAVSTNGHLLVKNNLLRFNSFFIQDSRQNKMNFNGQIDFSKPTDPLFGIEIQSQDFNMIDSPIKGIELVEGKLGLGLNIKINGSKSKLKVENEIQINKNTNIQYMMPGNQLELITDEGIVEYVDFYQYRDTVIAVRESSFIGDSLVSLVEGIDFTSILDIDPGATFTIVVDPNSGDYTSFNVKGKLNYTYKDSRKGRLVGRLEFQKGFYELSFYGLVKKRFQYEPGSTVSWSGNVMDGALNFAARHTVRTNSIGLVSNEISSNEKPLYNQRVPYDVILKIENKISEPTIAFALDLPERYRSLYPTLDSKLNQLNQPSLESERNKQVFALLVGGTFIPEDPSITEGSGGSNFATTAARNSVNAIMTQQLNNFTGKFVEGLDVDMGVNTFDDYGTGSAQTKTQLDVKVSKNLFNDRVTAEMESHINLDGSVKQVGQQNTAGMTEFAVSYKLTEAGNYRIKGFRENAYDIFDGEIQNSGIALIYIKEFDSFRKKTKEKRNEPEGKEKSVEE